MSIFINSLQSYGPCYTPAHEVGGVRILAVFRLKGLMRVWMEVGMGESIKPFSQKLVYFRIYGLNH